MSSWIDERVHPVLAWIVVGTTLLGALAIGSPVARRLLPARHPSDAAILALVTGLGLIAAVTAIVGSLGLPPPWAIVAALGVGAAAGARVIAAAIARSAALRARLRPTPRRVALAAVGALAAALPLSATLLPPVAWDDLVYHVDVPLRWTELGHAAVLPDNPYSAFPSALELLSSLGLRAGGGFTVPAAWSATGWLLLAATCLRLARPRSGRRTASALAFALSWSHVALLVATAAYVDAWIAVHAGALLLALREARGVPSPGCGLLLGLACGVKLTAASLIVLPLALTRWRRSRLIHWMLFALTATAAAAPFYARAVAATGNPLHPLYARWLAPDDPAAVALSDRHHALAARPFGSTHPLAAVASPILWARGGTAQQGSLGMQWLLVLVLAAIGAVRSGPARREAAVATALYAAWLATAQQLRFFLPGALLVHGAAARGAGAVGRRLQPAVAGVLLVATIASVPPSRWSAWGATLLAASRAASAPTSADVVHTAQADDYLVACDWIRRNAPTDAVVLLLGESRGLYVPRRHVVGTPGFQDWLLTGEVTPDAVMGALQEAGASLILHGRPARDPDVLVEDASARARLERALDELVASGRLTATRLGTHSVLAAQRPVLSESGRWRGPRSPGRS